MLPAPICCGASVAWAMRAMPTPSRSTCARTSGSALFSGAASWRCLSENGDPHCFYPKPRAGLGKSPQPLRENPIVVEQSGTQGHHRGGIVAAPAHAALFHATVDDQRHRSLDHPTAHRIAQLAPVLIGTNPRTLVLQIGERFLDGLPCLGGPACGQRAQA